MWVKWVSGNETYLLYIVKMKCHNYYGMYWNKKRVTITLAEREYFFSTMLKFSNGKNWIINCWKIQLLWKPTFSQAKKVDINKFDLRL